MADLQDTGIEQPPGILLFAGTPDQQVEHRRGASRAKGLFDQVERCLGHSCAPRSGTCIFTAFLCSKTVYLIRSDSVDSSTAQAVIDASLRLEFQSGIGKLQESPFYGR